MERSAAAPEPRWVALGLTFDLTPPPSSTQGRSKVEAGQLPSRAMRLLRSPTAARSKAEPERPQSPRVQLTRASFSSTAARSAPAPARAAAMVARRNDGRNPPGASGRLADHRQVVANATAPPIPFASRNGDSSLVRSAPPRNTGNSNFREDRQRHLDTDRRQHGHHQLDDLAGHAADRQWRHQRQHHRQYHQQRHASFNRSNTYTFAGTISGTGAVNQIGSGTTVLTGVNTYSGGTTISAGVLSVSADNNLGDAAGGLTFNGGVLQVTGTSFTGTSRAITWGLPAAASTSPMLPTISRSARPHGRRPAEQARRRHPDPDRQQQLHRRHNDLRRRAACSAMAAPAAASSGT